MRAMVLIRPDVPEAGVGSGERLMAEMGRFNTELVQAGVLLAAEGLRPSSDGIRVRFAGGSRTVVDERPPGIARPVAGFWLWQVRSLDEALEWVMRAPAPFDGATELEIRQVFEPGEVDRTGR